MKIIAPAKINLMLHFTGRRDDGYHLLQSAVAFADIGDELEIIESDAFSLTVDGLFAAHAPVGDGNLVTRAANGAKIAVKLTKNIPAGAGLGGGSADAAAILNYLNTQDLAQDLGADVPVSLNNTAQWMEGIGEKVSPVAFDPTHAVLYWPGQGLSTPEMYAAYKKFSIKFHAEMPKPDKIDPAFLSKTINDFTSVAVDRLPILKYVLTDLSETGAPLHVGLSGSGSACFALYADAVAAKKAAEYLSAAHPDAWIKACTLK